MEDRPISPAFLSRTERWLIAALVAVGLVVRLLDLPRPLDRQFDGFQGSFFALAAIDYERLEPQRDSLLPRGAGSGYPVVNLDLDPTDPEHFYVYANHPPLVPLIAWGSIAAFAPDGWDRAHLEHRAPAGVEAPLRAPFLALHLGAWALLVVALARGGAPRPAADMGAVFAWLPSSLLYAGLANYEQPSLFAVALATLGAVEYARFGRRRGLVCVALGAALGGLVTYAPAITVVLLGLLHWRTDRRRALLTSAIALIASAATLALHARAAGALLESRGEHAGRLAARIATLLGPLFDGSLPLERWLVTQAQLIGAQVGWVGVLLAAAGLALAARARTTEVRSAGATAAVLTLGGLGVQLAFYRHTGDPQDPFLIHLLPGIAAAAGLALARLGSRAPLPAAALLLAVCAEGAWRSHGLAERWRGRPSAAGELAPGAPAHELGLLIAELTPAGSVVWAPGSLGLGPSVGFYAWRTLLPVEPEAYAAAQLLAEDLGLGEAPTWLVAPAVRDEGTARVLEDLEAARPGSLDRPQASSRGWNAWRLR